MEPSTPSGPTTNTTNQVNTTTVNEVQESLQGLSVAEAADQGATVKDGEVHKNLTPTISPNPWSDSERHFTSTARERELVLVPTDVEDEESEPGADDEAEARHILHTPDPSTFDRYVTGGFASDSQASAPLVAPPPATEILQEFDPLADQEEEHAKKAWEESEGHPAPPLPRDRISSPPPPVPLKDLPSPSPIPILSAQSSGGFQSSLVALARSFSIPSLTRSPKSKGRPLSMDVAKPVPSPDTISSFATQQAKQPELNERKPESPDRQEEEDFEGSDTGSEDSGPGDPPFDFQKFLDQMKMRSADPVSKYLKSFLSNFSKRTFTVSDQIKIINDFLNFISNHMRQCEPWKTASDAEFDNAMEGMEKLVMNQLYQYTFTPAVAKDLNPITGLPRRPISVDDLERDRILSERIALFGWVEEKHLDIPVEEGTAGFLMFAEQELLKIGHYKAPRDKLICILNCCKVIFGLIRHLQKEEGADAFVPILIFVVLKANPDHLLSNVEFINRFRNPDKLRSEAGYYLSSLMGAVQFIESMDHTSLSNITQEEFEQNVEAAIQELPTNPDGTPRVLSRGSSSSSSSASSSLSSISTPTQRSSPHLGAESAQPLSLPLSQNVYSQAPMAQQLSEDARRLLQKTGDAVSKPLNAISRIFNEALDLAEENFGSPERYASASTSRAGTPSGSAPSFPVPNWPHQLVPGMASQSLPDSRSSSPASFIAQGVYQTPAPSADGGPPVQTPYKPRVRRVPSPGGYLNQAQAPLYGQSVLSPGYSPGYSPGFSPEDTPSRPRPSGQGPQTHYPLAMGPSQQVQPPARVQSLHPYYDQPGSPNLNLGSPLNYSRASTPGNGDLDIAGMQAEIDTAHSQATEASRNTLFQIFPGVDREVIEWVLEANEGDLGKSIEQLLEMSEGG
ncbi:hypothetical protein C8R41DRAFT_857809 [Lentinula lateritia]|uniref:Guanine nucleotide exchange factor Vps9 n=1 Tax=Lentinula lateritia TaxID=40482 RepID=A0ABQ8V2V9_9AGAR|nr:hypothetical protein C8R41DRAFT_857809 [Lentinula lateritia]